MLSKDDVIKAALLEVDSRVAKLRLAFDELNGSLTTSTKSSAGDKHETSRAMTQLEQEKLSKLLVSTVSLKEPLTLIKPHVKNTTIGFGSLFSTNRGIYFISSPIGKIIIENKEVYCLSPVTPLAKIFNGKAEGDVVQLNNQTYSILDVI